MKFSALLSAVVFVAVAQATSVHIHKGSARGGVAGAHRRHAAAVGSAPVANNLVRRKGNGRCKPRPATSSAAAPEPTPPPPPAVPAAPAAPSTTAQPAAPTSSGNGNGNGNTGGSGGIITVGGGNCGNSGATQDITADSGPNGSLDWMICGMNSGGWTPPHLGIQDLKVVDLNWAVSQDGSPFKACSADIIGKIVYHANQNNIPPIMIASFIMQESSCNPDTVGKGGEQGLMQLTHDKCGNAPGGYCRDVDYNIATGTAFFAQTLRDVGGNVLEAAGKYNGYFKGMTYDDATRAATTTCCGCQNNLDYLHQFLNGWCQNRDSYTGTPRLGKYFNLDRCNY